MPYKRCLFVVTHYCPLIGGGQSVYDAYARQRPDLFQVLTSSRDYATGQEVPGYLDFDKAAPYKISRIGHTRPDIGAETVRFQDRAKGWLVSRRIEKNLIQSILDICAADDIDVICVGAAEAFTWLPAKLKKYTDIPIVYYTHGEEFSQQAHSERADQSRQSAIQSSDGVIAVSSFTRDLLIKRYGARPERTRLIHNGVDFDAYGGSSATPAAFEKGFPEQLTVVAAGRMIARKGFDKLIEAWPAIIEKVPTARLFMAGKGPLFEPLKESIDHLGLSDSVQQLGYVSDEALIDLYCGADLFVMPNRTLPNGDTEGFGLVFLEAAAAGAPSVGGRAGGATDAIIEGVTGLLVNAEEIGEIAAAVSDMLLDDDKRQRMAQAANEHARSNDWHHKVIELIDFFDELTAKRG